jgi:hypothetical protein
VSLLDQMLHQIEGKLGISLSFFFILFFIDVLQDIGRSTQPTIRELKDLLTTKLKKWLINATGLPLNNKLSLTAARYESHGMIVI